MSTLNLVTLGRVKNILEKIGISEIPAILEKDENGNFDQSLVAFGIVAELSSRDENLLNELYACISGSKAISSVDSETVIEELTRFFVDMGVRFHQLMKILTAEKDNQQNLALGMMKQVMESKLTEIFSSINLDSLSKEVSEQ